MVALSVSISAITSPGLTGSPSFLSHLARLPFSMVGDSAGIRMLIGIGLASLDGSTDDRDRAGRFGRIHLGQECLADALACRRFAELGLASVGHGDLPRRRCQECAPRRRIVE